MSSRSRHLAAPNLRGGTSPLKMCFCVSVVLVSALGDFVWAEPPHTSPSRGPVRLDHRASVQLGFLPNDSTDALLTPARSAFPPADRTGSFTVPDDRTFATGLVSTSGNRTARPPQRLTTARDDEDSPVTDLTSVWWSDFVTARLRESATPLSVSIEEILVRAIKSSAQVKVSSDLPLIRETAITEADAQFDWTTFLDTRWQDLNDPVGNSLTIGVPGVRRYKNENLIGQAGIRKKTRSGGTLQFSEQLGWQQTNSAFFLPNPQGTSRLVLGYTHPLLRGAGEVYNESLIVLAQIDSQIACDELHRQLQTHLLDVLKAYWNLYLERANLAQKLQSLKRASDTLDFLKRRQQLDAVQSQVLRAQAEVASRRSQVIRAQMGVKNAEDRIRALVNDPAFGEFDTVELLPSEAPTVREVPLHMATALGTAVTIRPEINQALRQIQAACTRLQMSKNDVLPMLNLVTEAYVAGLKPDNSFAAFRDSFQSGSPGYTVGLQFEMPLGNRAAKARQERRELELRQLRHQYATTLSTLQLEVKVAVREVETALAEMFSQYRAMTASAAELEHLEQRFRKLPGEDGTAGLVLDNLLLAQNRLATNEFNFLTAEVNYNLALWNVKKATGELLQTEQVSFSRCCVEELPTLVIDKYGKPVEHHPAGQVMPTPAEPVPQRQLPPPAIPNEPERPGPSLRPVGGRVEPKPSAGPTR
jgi:outer membrane protein TolC